MTIQQLKYIIALDDERHYVRAAKRSNVSQPTLTMQVKKLEEELGILLFERKTKPLTPTSHGNQIISKARQILAEVQTLYDFANDEYANLGGEFVLGIIPTISSSMLPMLAPALEKALPGTKWEVREMQTSEIIKGIVDRTIDMAILSTPLNEKDIRELPLYSERFLFYAPKDHHLHSKKGIQASDVQLSDLLLLEEGHCFREQMLNICGSRGQSPKTMSLTSGNLDTLKRLVQTGMGTTLIPELAVSKEDEPFTSPFKEPSPAREIALVCHNHFPREALLSKLSELIKNVLPPTISSQDNTFRVEWRRRV
jgi:LysR family hydrogen peroxide-inducible transcriptional activator